MFLMDLGMFFDVCVVTYVYFLYFVYYVVMLILKCRYYQF